MLVVVGAGLVSLSEPILRQYRDLEAREVGEIVDGASIGQLVHCDSSEITAYNRFFLIFGGSVLLTDV